MKPSKNKTASRIIFFIAAFWLIFICSTSLGIYIYAAKKWPYPLVKEIEKFIKGNSEEKTSLIEKIQNDLNFKPARHIVHSQKHYTIPQNYKELKGLPIKSRRLNPKIFLSKDAPAGYRLIYGIFDFKKSYHGAVLLGPDGKVENIWYISQEDVEWTHRPDTNVFPHGIEILPDGSIINAYDSGSCLTRYDYCGNIIWRIKGGFHHSIAFDEKDTIWTWGNQLGYKPYGDNIMQIDCKTGTVLKKFHLNQVMESNPDIDIFGVMQEDYAGGSKWIKDEAGGRWHANDVEALSEDLADFYPQFKAGDLLISLRAPDLVCVLDPDSYKVKWWRQGLTRRQHDPDWNSRGSITIFNNNMHKGYSSIVDIDPSTFKFKKLVDGEKYEFYSWIQGKHQAMPNGGFLISSPQQGRVFEIDQNGKITFEFINIYGENNAFLAISEAIFIPLDYFKELPKCSKP